MKAPAMFFTVLLLVVGIDQGSKVWARDLPTSPADCTTAQLAAHVCQGVPRPVIEGVWDWERAANPGAAFSSLIGSRVLLSLIALAALVGLGVAASRTRPEQRLERAALAMIAGGALGNLVDRVREGAVTDFVRWKAWGHAWPIFNVADAALLVGVVLLLAASRKKSPTVSAGRTIAT